MRLHIFFDTNMFLECIMFDSLNWKEIIEQNKDWSLIIPITVLEELDHHKYSSNTRKQKRSRKILSKFIKKQQNEVASNIDIQFLDQFIDWAKLNDEFPEYNIETLDRLDNDTKIIMEILQFSTNESNSGIIFFTNDFSMSLKSKRFNIETFLTQNDERFKKNESKNGSDQENIKNKEPLLSLTLYNDGKKSIIKKIIDLPMPIPYFDEPESTFNIMRTYDKDDIERYNRNVDRYNERFLLYSQIHKIDLILTNEGICTATDIDIFIALKTHESIRMLSSAEYEDSKPKLPQKPRTLIDSVQEVIIAKYRPQIISNQEIERKEKQFPVRKSEEDSGITQTIHYEFKKLKSNISHHLIPFYLLIPRDTTVNVVHFHVNYSIEEYTPRTTDKFKLVIN